MSHPIMGISSMATRQVLAEVIDAWRQRSGLEVCVESTGGLDAARRVHDGEKFDVAVLAANAIEKLVAADRILRGSVTDIAHSGVAIAVRRGVARPDVETEEALRKAVLAAGAIGYSTGPSGVALQEIFARWGIADVIKGRVVQAPPGVPVGTLIARGEVELGFQQLSELMHLEGIDVIGPMPPGLAIVTTFSGGVCASSTQPDAARAFLDFIRSPAADGAKRRHGMEPT
jgi:molybdate transport system substrate-binding protein